tara:strand:- start:36 stop:914 length:879 start_codon:yes stop_codon:yes gene_type:complete
MAEEQVELELEQEQDTEVEVPEGDKKEETLLVAETEQTDNFEKAESATQKRIDRLTKKMREAERQREEAISYAQKVQAESLQLKERMNTLDTNYVSEFSNRVQSELQATEAEMKKAMELNDTQGVVEAQRKMTNLAIQNDRAEQAKQQQELNAKQQSSAEEKQMAENKQQYSQMATRRPSPKAEAWAQKNDWFGQDEAMTYAAFGIHKKMIEDEGFDAESDEYYTELDRRVQKEFPHKFNGGSKRPAQTVASVSRTTTGRTSNRKVRLTPSQVAIAKRLGVPIEEYAKHVKE